MESTTIMKTKEETLNYLKAHNVVINHIENHEKVDTVQMGLEKFKSVSFTEEFVFAKNLFLKSKAGGLYLLTVHPVKDLLIFRNLQLISKLLKKY